MEKKEAVKIPFNLVVLDFFGTALLGLGVAKKFAGLNFLPLSMQFENDAVVFIILGILCMLPFIIYLLSKIREQSERKLIK
jgi:hypothetical protein